jgi:hypothetical protein
MNKGTNGCMYNCGDSCTGECMKPMDDGMNKLNKPQPPAPPKDRIYIESSWLETITFGLYKTKKYHRKDEQIR